MQFLVYGCWMLGGEIKCSILIRLHSSDFWIILNLSIFLRLYCQMFYVVYRTPALNLPNNNIHYLAKSAILTVIFHLKVT